MTNWTPQEEVRLVEYITQRVCDRAAGRLDPECHRNNPRDVYFIGNIRPFEVRVAEDGYMGELMNKLSPVAFGAEFRISPDARATVQVNLGWTCYYRVLPTFQQQLEHQGRRVGPKQDANSAPVGAQPSPEQTGSTGVTALSASTGEATDLSRDRRRPRISKDSLFLRFKKVQCNAGAPVTILREASGYRVDASELQSEVDRECARAQQVCAEDPIRFRTDGPPEKNVLVPERALSSEADFTAFLSSLTTEVRPVWKVEIRAEVRLGSEAGLVGSFQFVNKSPRQTDKENLNVESFLFDSHAQFDFGTTRVLPFELELAPRGFRFDRNLWGRGFNCAVERSSQDGNRFLATHVPVYRQMRYVTKTRPRASFAELAANPLPSLDAILNAMEQYRRVWAETRASYAARSEWEEQHGREYDRDSRQFEDEIARFRLGRKLIEDDPDVQLAFKLTNETFRRGPKSEWRLFQIVFLVTQIPSMVALGKPIKELLSERELVDIIYFPTGGGKTEAYLAVLVFHCFLDRLRGKSGGVTAWTRFPLRLLTLQQTQRVADVIGIAELVRREQSDIRLAGPGVDGFAVGYFVGLGGSPNEIADPAKVPKVKPEVQLAWSIANDPEARQAWKRVVRCPACGTATVKVDFDAKRCRVLHRCTRPRCAFPNGEVPVYIVDNEIYRYLPAVLVGTIDKLAGLGNQRKISQLLGVVDGRCDEHGYYKAKCCQKDCRDRKLLRPGQPKGLSGPTLFVQDELHLLKEGLGTFDGHYETFTQELLREFGLRSPLKIIASSATIEAFERQVEHLYGRPPSEARIFPGPGPTLRGSFYAQTEAFPQRVFVGVLPHNKTIFNAILELIDLYHRELQGLSRVSSKSANPFAGDLRPGTPPWFELIDFYQTSLTYFLVGRELNSIRTDIEGDVSPNLMKDGLLPLNVLDLTGNTGTDDVASTLERLEKPAVESASPDAVLATSMVSHGVDIDRLNAMIFYGMPRQNAEYIQASSRVGRAHVGIVLTCLHPARERDQSHYAYFVKFHEFLGQLVEPVAINRWAKFSIDRTLPGLFMGVLLQVLATRSGTPDRYYILDYVKQQISTGAVKVEDFIPFLERAYFLGQPPAGALEVFRDEIRVRAQQFFDQIISAGAGYSFVSDVLIPRPMRSLRDVDEPIDIELDSEGTVWGAQSSKQSGGSNGPTDD